MTVELKPSGFTTDRYCPCERYFGTIGAIRELIAFAANRKHQFAFCIAISNELNHRNCVRVRGKGVRFPRKHEIRR